MSETKYEMTYDEMRNLVCRSYQYVAMYNTNNNFAMDRNNPFCTMGWNKMYIPEGLMDASVTAIPRPNNDTLYLMSMLDMRDDAIVIEFPVFDETVSKYVSLETSAYDHYVNVPLSTTKGDFRKDRTRMLFYTERTKGYNGESVPGIEEKNTLKMTGDFAIAFLRVAPTNPDGIFAVMKNQKLMTLSEFLGKKKQYTTNIKFPDYGKDQDVFRENFLEVMQFVFNYTTFDPETYEMDREVLAALKPLGVEPGQIFDPKKIAQIDGEKLAEVAQEVENESLKTWNAPDGNPYLEECFKPKDQMTIEPMTVQSAVGPIGLPADQAQYPGIGTGNGALHSTNHYVISMTAEELPPAKAFWSVTLYDAENGLFIPNDNNKYSVGENAGIELDESGGIEIHISPEQPEGVPDKNWLPSGDIDQDLDVIMRIYYPDLEKMPSWEPPQAILKENGS